MPGLLSSRIYAVDVATNPKAPKIDAIIEPNEVYDVGSAIPHTTHCLANGDIMISCLADGPEENGKGSFILIDGKTFKVIGWSRASSAINL
jgi:selenium-binding protein 1